VIRGHILQKILTHALQRHCQIPAEGVYDSSVLIQALLELPSATKAAMSGKPVTVDTMSSQQAVQTAFEKLSTTLRNLSGLPMGVSTVIGAAPGEVLLMISVFKIVFPLPLTVLVRGMAVQSCVGRPFSRCNPILLLMPPPPLSRNLFPAPRSLSMSS
jgi:Nrap protein nucleotidyltransferase domain 4